MSRKGDIKEMANFVGNSAAHIALFPDDEFVRKEIETYMEMASNLAAGRAWNDWEVNEFREKARRRARSEIKRRIDEHGFHEKKFDDFLDAAEEYIDRFVKEELAHQA